MKKNNIKTRRNKRSRRLNYGQPRNAPIILPSRFPRAQGDVVSMHCKGLIPISASLTGFSKGYMWMVPSFQSVNTLATCVPNLSALSELYSRFIVTSMTVKIIPTISVLQGAVFAVNYEPALNESPASAGNPQNLNDVVVSVHHATTTQSTPKSFTVRPIDYYGDWRATNGQVLAETQNNQGIVQWYSSYTATEGTVIGHIEVDFHISYCGLRQFDAAT